MGKKFRKKAKNAIQVERGALGHMLSIVAQDDVIWGLYLRVVKRDINPSSGKAKDV